MLAARLERTVHGSRAVPTWLRRALPACWPHSGVEFISTAQLHACCSLRFVGGVVAFVWLFARSQVECAATIRETPGSIGYLDAGHGRNQEGLGEVSLRNAAGAYVTSSDLATSKGLELVAEYAVKNNVFNADYTDDWSSVALLNLGSVW